MKLTAAALTLLAFASEAGAAKTPIWKVTGTGSNYWPVHDTSSGTNTSWIKGTKMCGSVSNCYEPTSKEGIKECTTTGLGICGSGSIPEGDFFVTRVENLGLVKESEYMTCSDITSNCEKATTVSYARGYRDVSKGDKDAANEPAYIQTGIMLKDPISNGVDSWAYVSVASYLNIGSSTIKTKTNGFYLGSVSAGSTPNNPVSRYDAYGHPGSQTEICIADKKNSACGDEVEFSPDAYKFSILFMLNGNDWNTVAADSKYDHFVVRMLVNHASTWTPYVNDFVTVDKSSSLDATRIMFNVNNQYTIKFDFKKTFNIGNIGTYGTPTDTKTLKIRVSKKSATSFYVDYLFPKGDNIKAGKYVVYDPTISFEDKKLVVPTPQDSAATTVTSGASLVFSLALLSFVGGLF